jgi:predicted ATP-binding protein involved in virulence
MKISKLKIENFRNIGPLQSFELNPHFTTIIGVNGRGKSTILSAMRIACGSYLLGIVPAKKRHIHPSEIRLEDKGKHLTQQRPVVIAAEGNFDEVNETVYWQRQIPENSNSTTSNEAEVGAVRKLARDKYEKVVIDDRSHIAFPIIAFFGTSRAHGAGRVRSTRIGREIFKEGYQDWYEMKSSTYSYEDWLTSYEVLKKERKEFPQTKDAFIEAIRTANPYITKIKVVGGQLWLKVNIDGEESSLLPIEYLSDGIRFFTEMVAELAYRCVVLNGFLKNLCVKESKGVVMIDELDLHLHPNWQRHVVKDLKEAFPNLQFVVTTHSPFIVQSMKSEELIILDKDIVKDGDPFRKSIEEVSAAEMGVDDVPRSKEFLEMQQVAEEYFSLISAGKNSENHDRTRELRSKLNDLEEIFGEDPAFVAALKVERTIRGL